MRTVFKKLVAAVVPMAMFAAATVAALLAGCPNPPSVPPNPPDASDASFVASDANMANCQIACDVIRTQLGCLWASSSVCPTSLANIETGKIRHLANGHPFTCAEVAVGDPKSLGIGCGE